MNVAVYSETGPLRFSTDKGTASCVSDDGDARCDAVALDDILQDEERVSFIKMDVEGCELAALKGGEGIIRRDRPKLAICIYHKLEDLWEIPLYIHSLYDGYRIYVRNYEDQLYEIVCYAISRQTT